MYRNWIFSCKKNEKNSPPRKKPSDSKTPKTNIKNQNHHKNHQQKTGKNQKKKGKDQVKKFAPI
jgi:hypothetical protein